MNCRGIGRVPGDSGASQCFCPCGPQLPTRLAGAQRSGAGRCPSVACNSLSITISLMLDSVTLASS